MLPSLVARLSRAMPSFGGKVMCYRSPVLATQLKACLFPGCTHEFPEHYFSSYCGAHTQREVCLYVIAQQTKGNQQIESCQIETAVDTVLDAIEGRREVDQTFVEEISAQVYAKQIKSVGALIPSELMKLYTELSDLEKETYRQVVRLAIRAYQQAFFPFLDII